jgi:starch synthase
MNILYAASEALPYIATGGLADVAGSLPRAQLSKDCDTRVVIPLYSEIPQDLRNSLTYVMNFYVPVSWRQQYCGVFTGEAGGVKYYLLDNEYYFKRQGIYGHYDDAERFAFFSRAVLELIRHIDFQPDIIHCNDWHTALIPVFHRVFYKDDPTYSNIKTVFTIHNIIYQGKYGKEIFEDVLGLPNWAYPLLEYDDCLNFMKGAIVCSNAVTTVSNTYAQELRYPYFSYGLHHILQDCSYKFSGILNGIDVESYNPKTDKCIFKNYSAADTSGKAVNKKRLQKLFGLPEDENAMLIGMVTRLVEPKGIELVKFVLEELMTDHVQLIILGKGDWNYESYFCEMQKRYPAKLAVCIGFLQDMARKIYAGSDAFLMPSITEPCGLSQMVAMRYGTIPIVRETGGLKDSVIDNGNDNGNGYTFKSVNAHDMLGAIRRAEGAFANKPYWSGVVKRALESDFSWDKSADEYVSLYKRVFSSY